MQPLNALYVIRLVILDTIMYPLYIITAIFSSCHVSDITEVQL